MGVKWNKFSTKKVRDSIFADFDVLINFCKKKKKKNILAPLSIDKYFCSFPICLDFVGNTKKNFFLRIFFSASGSKFWVCLGEENKNDKVWHYEKTFIQIQGVPSIGTHFRFKFLTFLMALSKKPNSAILTQMV